jgi:A/G-specific adenine glycosylase
VRAVRPRLPPGAARAFQAGLLAWFDRHGRDLPWRRTRDPYRILVSEVMLQQTQVERVKDYYERFLREYPTVQDLAAARPSQVRESWDGLGYYARARHLHAAARRVVQEHAGEFPHRPEELMELPGIGRYTAGAVVSFAYGQPAPILDTNVRRVLTRVFVRRRPARRGTLDRRLWGLAELLIPDGKAWEFNQALMDFGAVMCTARTPRCPRCPLLRLCAWRRASRQRTEPQPTTRRSPK